MKTLTIDRYINRSAAGAIFALQPDVQQLATPGFTFWREDLESQGLVKPDSAVIDLVKAMAIRYSFYGDEAEMELLKKHVQVNAGSDPLLPSIVIEQAGPTASGKSFYANLRFIDAIALWSFAQSWPAAQQRERERLQHLEWQRKVNREQRERDEAYFQDTLKTQFEEQALIPLDKTEHGWSRDTPGVFAIWKKDIDELRTSEDPLVLTNLGACEDEQFVVMDLLTVGQLGRLILHIIDAEGFEGPHVRMFNTPDDVVELTNGQKRILNRDLVVVDCRRYLGLRHRVAFEEHDDAQQGEEGLANG